MDERNKQEKTRYKLAASMKECMKSAPVDKITLQIVLRTDEISVDDDDAKTVDAEVAKAKESPLRRMWNVLVQMWKAMVSIFKNR